MSSVDKDRALAHYTAEFAKLSFQVGDHVRAASDNGAAEWLIVIETDDIRATTLTHHYPAGTRRFDNAELELVERAYYAPPGVPMVRLDEAIAAIRRCKLPERDGISGMLSSQNNAAIDVAIRALEKLAEAPT